MRGETNSTSCNEFQGRVKSSRVYKKCSMHFKINIYLGQN